MNQIVMHMAACGFGADMVACHALDLRNLERNFGLAMYMLQRVTVKQLSRPSIHTVHCAAYCSVASTPPHRLCMHDPQSQTNCATNKTGKQMQGQGTGGRPAGVTLLEDWQHHCCWGRGSAPAVALPRNHLLLDPAQCALCRSHKAKAVRCAGAVMQHITHSQ